MQSDDYGCAGDSPLAAIRRLVAHGASGELIAASDAIEVHVYLLDGRLAWATSSTARQAFVERLIERHGVPGEAIREVIEECQRTRRRLGETLVDWGLATADQVRDALGAQIAGALATVAAHPSAQTIFLPRRMSYARELTFDLGELVAERVPSDLDEQAARIVATVLDSMPEVGWVEVTAGNDVPARAARGVARPDEDLATVRRALDAADLDSVVVRGCSGVVLGQRLADGRATIWCGAGPDVKIGVAAALLASAAGVTAPARQSIALATTWQERPVPRCSTSVLAGAIRTAEELVAAMVIDPDGRAGGVWRGPDDLDSHARAATAMAPVLSSPRTSALRPLAMRGQRGQLAYHGTCPSGLRGTMWLVLPSWVSQGLGWALLQAVSRQVTDAGGES